MSQQDLTCARKLSDKLIKRIQKAARRTAPDNLSGTYSAVGFEPEKAADMEGYDGGNIKGHDDGVQSNFEYCYNLSPEIQAAVQANLNAYWSDLSHMFHVSRGELMYTDHLSQRRAHVCLLPHDKVNASKIREAIARVLELC